MMPKPDRSSMDCQRLAKPIDKVNAALSLYSGLPRAIPNP